MPNDERHPLRSIEVTPRQSQEEYLRELANKIIDKEELAEERFQRTGRRPRPQVDFDRKKLYRFNGGYDIYREEKKKRDQLRVGLGLINNVLMADDKEDVVNTHIGIAERFAEQGLVDPSFPEELRKFVLSHFARVNEASPPPIPDRKFQARQDDIIPFLREVWGEWLGRSLLTKAILRNADRNAVIALNNWLRPEAGNALPEDIDIPGQAEANDRFLARGYFTADEVHRASGALLRRQP